MTASRVSRLRAIQAALSPASLSQQASRTLHSSASMTFAKPADSLKDARIISRDPLPEPKWVQLEGIRWKTPDGKEKVWECASRKTRGKSGVDAISVLALISHPSKPLSTVLVIQFRPPADSICVELPAGLVDADEDPSKAGERELYEETGYKGQTEACSPVIMSDPGMSSANMCVSTVRVELKEGEELVEPKQHLDEGEYIEKRIVAMKDLYQTLLDYDKLGYKVDARLMNLAWGLETARKYQDKF